MTTEDAQGSYTSHWMDVHDVVMLLSLRRRLIISTATIPAASTTGMVCRSVCPRYSHIQYDLASVKLKFELRWHKYKYLVPCLHTPFLINPHHANFNIDIDNIDPLVSSSSSSMYLSSTHLSCHPHDPGGSA
jgi:hypothetical protein